MFFYNKNFKNYFMFSEKYQWVFNKFNEYALDKNIYIFSDLVNYNYLGRLPLIALNSNDVIYIKKKLYQLHSVFYSLDKLLFLDKGSILMLHKDPGYDFISYNDDNKEISQFLEHPHTYIFPLSLFI